MTTFTTARNQDQSQSMSKGAESVAGIKASQQSSVDKERSIPQEGRQSTVQGVDRQNDQYQAEFKEQESKQSSPDETKFEQIMAPERDHIQLSEARVSNASDAHSTNHTNSPDNQKDQGCTK